MTATPTTTAAAAATTTNDIVRLFTYIKPFAQTSFIQYVYTLEISNARYFLRSHPLSFTHTHTLHTHKRILTQLQHKHWYANTQNNRNIKYKYFESFLVRGKKWVQQFARLLDEPIMLDRMIEWIGYVPFDASEIYSWHFVFIYFVEIHTANDSEPTTD